MTRYCPSPPVKPAASFTNLPSPARPADEAEILTRDHYIDVRSSVPAIAGQPARLYVRERVSAAAVPRITGDQVVLCVHGSGTPGSVAFDVPYQDYSWMSFLAAAGYDVFAVDLTGYGRSTRPAAMDDLANLAAEQRTPFGVPESQEQSYPGALTTLESDWDDLSAVVSYLRQLRAVERVALIGWSRGGPRAGGWAVQHPDEVSKLVLLAPSYERTEPVEERSPPVPGPVFNTQNRAEFFDFWNRQTPSPDHYDPRAAQAVWNGLLASDPVGATWGPGVRRAPEVAGAWGPALAKKLTTPTLVVAPEHDAQILPERVRELHADLGSSQKVFVDLARSSHNALWERNHLLLFRASLEWLDHGTVNGQANGVVRLGYDEE
ncbi:MAG: hypothetical protein RLZZ15_1914 [Verrucomicrobiota bacterium]|jgi:pimeloyl-ACP methyl ester carboxylesterase